MIFFQKGTNHLYIDESERGHDVRKGSAEGMCIGV